jgi:NADPH-dependent 2,4-dienoyl-CoA reductase/sulfur reductase-like enzyme
VVDEYLRSSVPGLFAAGDVTYAYNPTAGRHLAVEHWGEALEMGGIAGANAAGQQRRWTQAPGFWSTIGDHTLKYVAWGDGFDEARLRVHDRDTNGFTAWYGREGIIVGVATHHNDDDYEQGRDLVERGAPMGPVG